MSKISRGYIEVQDEASDEPKRFRIYGEGLLPGPGGVEYVVYTDSVKECGVAGGDGAFNDERKATPLDVQRVIAHLRQWASDHDRNWDFE